MIPPKSIEARVRTWKSDTERLPEHLQQLPARVRRAARERARFTLHARRVRRARVLAFAASFLLAALVLGALSGGTQHPSTSGIDIVGGEALEALVAAQRLHEESAQAVAEKARVRLARADLPETPAAEAARLTAFRERLRSLDDTIARSRAFLANNPYHAPARLSLLRAYERRGELLSQLASDAGMLT